jgi:hypothetical protein
LYRLTSAIPFVVAAATSLAVACSAPPVGPSPLGEFSSPPVPFSLIGVVLDGADRPLANVRVEVVDGPGLGAFGVTDASGRYEIQTVLSDSMTVRAAKDGYVTLMKTYRHSLSSPTSGLLSFSMELDGPSVNVAGDYSITFTADSACTQPSAVARSRTYQAAIIPSRIISRPNWYDVVLSGASFYRGSPSFLLAVVGSSAQFKFDSDYPYSGLDPFIIEELAPTTYLTMEGVADADVGGDTPISASFRGYFALCTGFALCAEPVYCNYSSNNRLTVTRR